MYIKAKIIFLLAILHTISGCSTAPEYTPQGVKIESVVNQVKAALVTTQKDLQSKNMPGLASVIITLSLVGKVETSGELKLWVLSGGPSASSEAAQKISIKLTPPPKDTPEDVSAFDLYKSLVDAIVAAAVTASEAQRAAGIGEPKLQLSAVTTSVKFSVSNKVGGGIGFDVGGLTVGVKGSNTVSDSHEIAFKFE